MIDLERLRDIADSIPSDLGGGSAFSKISVIAILAEMQGLATFIEIGVYRGRSFFPIAWSFSTRRGTSIGVDPYTRAAAAEEDLPVEIADTVRSFISTADYEDLYLEAQRRLFELNLQSSTHLLRLTSEAAIELFRRTSLEAGLIHVDGNHDTRFVMADVENYVPLLCEGGLLVLDDIDWPSVKPAFDRCSQTLVLIHMTETFAIFAKVEDQTRIDQLRQASASIWRQVTEHGPTPTLLPAQPMVSVSIITYNQAAYIGSAIESALSQIADFPIEIVISDDLSTDGTREICESFARRFPEKIRLTKRSRNLGAVRNYLETYKDCRGRYVAFLEGDDFWTDVHKLQRQVDFLELNPDYAICCHNVYRSNEAGELGALLLEGIPDTTTVEDLCAGDYISTPSCVVRNRQIQEIPEWMFALPGCDWALDILSAEHGKIRFLAEPMAAYRMHGASIWSSLPPVEQCIVAIKLATDLNHHLGYRYDRQFQTSIRKSKLYLDQLIASELGSIRQLTAELRAEVGPLARSGAADPMPRKPRVLKRLRRSIRDSVVRQSRALAHTLLRKSEPLLDLIVADDAYPHPQSAFRREEFDAYLREFPLSAVHTTGSAFSFFKDDRPVDVAIRERISESAELKGRIRRFDRNRIVRARLGYVLFAGNAWQFVEFFERNQIPFVFTLYPGGAFLVEEAASDERLRRVFNSPMFRRVITTQKLTRDYVVRKGLLPADKVEFIYGVVTPKAALRGAGDRSPPRQQFGIGKETFDICFTAHKYLPSGHDKGYDIFLDVARRLLKAEPRCRFHVVGGFAADDLPVDGLEGKITFYGGQKPDWFVDFYRDKDLILLANVPFVLIKGAFDGFPTATGSDAMLAELPLFCTDPLNLNCEFVDGRDLVIVPHDTDAIVEKILWYRDRPEKLRDIGVSGRREALRVYGYDRQVIPRIRILRSELG